MPQDSSAGQTVLRRRELFRDRWSSLGEDSGIVEVSEQLSPAALKEKVEAFRDFSDELLLEIGHDISIARWKAGSVLFEEGTYIDLAFLIIQGKVEIYLERLRESQGAERPFFDPNRTGIHRMEDLQTIPAAERKPSPRDAGPKDESSTRIGLLTNMDVSLPDSGAAVLGEGEIVGEIGALSGWPQSATARTLTDCEVVQIRLPALRQLKRKSKEFKEWVDRVYRERSLVQQLKATPILHHCPESALEELEVELESYRRGQGIVQEGDPADALYIVRSGFVRLSQAFADGQITVTYLSKGMTLGEIELLIEGVQQWRCSAASVEHSELVKIPASAFQGLLSEYPRMNDEVWELVVQRIKEIGAGRSDVSRSEFLEASLGNGMAQGSSVLVIDLNTCTRCDDCVRACADTHEGRTRFVREGDRYRNFLITRSCFHCQDPVCLIGCPTGAIRRAAYEDVVEIKDDICIGCSACANNCPYDAIVMHDMQETWPADTLPKRLRNKPRTLASKCDLCYDKGHDPACVTNCPHGCAIRVGSVDDFSELFPEGR